MNYSKVLVITEDWCGDAMMNLPILKHISEALNLEVRVFHRDDDQFETMETVWGPRANEVQKFVTDVRADKLPSKDHPDYADLEKKHTWLYQIAIKLTLHFGKQFIIPS